MGTKYFTVSSSNMYSACACDISMTWCVVNYLIFTVTILTCLTSRTDKATNRYWKNVHPRPGVLYKYHVRGSEKPDYEGKLTP